jgi:hypothetical protein
VARFEFRSVVAAPPELVFDLWNDLDRAREWLVGLQKVTDRSGPPDQPGSSHVLWFNGRPAPVTVLEVDRPLRIVNRLGGGLFKGTLGATFEPQGGGTRITEWLEPEGLGPTIAGWIFSKGSWRGSFQGELKTFKQLAEREAQQRDAAEKSSST